MSRAPQCNGGYRIGHIEQKRTSPEFDSPLAPLEEVDMDTLAYDVEDLRRYKVDRWVWQGPR